MDTILQTILASLFVTGVTSAPATNNTFVQPQMVAVTEISPLVIKDECTESLRKGIPGLLGMMRQGIEYDMLSSYLVHDLHVCNMTPADIGTSESELRELTLKWGNKDSEYL